METANLSNWSSISCIRLSTFSIRFLHFIRETISFVKPFHSWNHFTRETISFVKPFHSWNHFIPFFNMSLVSSFHSFLVVMFQNF